MTEALYDHWQEGLSPFDGVTIAMREPVPVSTLQPLLASIAAFLGDQFGNEQLYFLHDWHEHDGVKIEGTAVKWSALHEDVSSVNKLLAVFDGADTFVRRAYYVKTYDFYFRYIVHEPYSAATIELPAEFDLTCSPVIAEEVLRIGSGGGELYQISPDEYFRVRQV